MRLEDIAIKVEGVWLPKDEQHMLHWMTKGKKAFRKDGKITYQWQKQEAAMALANLYRPAWRKSVFVDVGGHCGFWSMWWGKEASRVVAFEPIDYLREIYKANMPPEANYMLLPYALSDTPGKLEMKVIPENTGATRVWAEGEHRPEHIKTYEVDVTTLDELLPSYLNGEPMSVLKIDCEGFEEKVVWGGKDVIRAHLPVVIVEQKFEHRHFAFEKNGAVHLLEKWGYRVVKSMSGDHVMIPENLL